MYQVWWILVPPIDAQRHGVLFAVWEPNGAHNTVDTNVGAYNTVCVRAVEEHCSRRRTGYGPGIVVLTLCAAFSVRPWSLPSGRTWSDGPSRLGLRQSEKSGKQASYGVPG